MKSEKVPIDLASVEVEKGEVTLTPTLQTFKIGGNKHYAGGTPQLLPEGTKVFSDYLKAEEDLVKQLVGKNKKMSYAKMASSYNTNEEIAKLNDDNEDELGKKTAQIMLSKKLAQLESIFQAQETSKEHNSKLTLSDLFKKIELGKEVMKNGGVNSLEKYQNGRVVPASAQPLIGTNKPITFLEDKEKDLSFQYRPMFSDTKFVENDLGSKRVLNNPDVEEYQAKIIGYDLANKKYLTDPLSVELRRQTVENILKNNTATNYGSKTENWNYIDVFDSKGNPIIKGGVNQVTSLPEGDFTFNVRKNALGHELPSFIDSHNAKNQPIYFEKKSIANELKKPLDKFSDFQSFKESLNPKIPTNINIPKTALNYTTDTSTETAKPLPSSNLDDVYKMGMFKDIADLATLEVRPPHYNYKPQNIAYQRYLPMNTLAAERQFNLQKEKLENSNLPENVKQAYLNDMYSKLQDNISEVQLKNYQGDNQTDNQNVSIYNSITDQNRKEQIGYDDKFDELNARTLYNRDVEKLRLKDSLINNYGKYKKQKLMLNLVNQLGDNYYFDGEKVQYIPGKGTINTENPMEQYKQDKINKIVESLNNNPTEAQAKVAEAQIKAIQLLGK